MGTVYHGDCIETMRTLPDNSVDSIVTDPPYGLGFMGKHWDNLPPGLEWAEECLRVLKPGGHLLAFGGTRTWHRLAVAVEDAGFEIRDSIAWMYGSGFPKSLDVSKAIDKANGKHDRDLAPFGAYVRSCRQAKGWTLRQLDEAMGTNTAASWWEGRKAGVQPPDLARYTQLKGILDMDGRFDDLIEWLEAEREVIGSRTNVATRIYDGGAGPKLPDRIDVTAPATPEAEQWQGWGTALKPAFEPVVVARKPFTGTVAGNVQTWGTGALNIDATRIATDDKLGGGGPNSGGAFRFHGFTSMMELKSAADAGGACPDGSDAAKVYATQSAGAGYRDNSGGLGRWPANVVLDETTAELLDQQSGVTTSKSADRGKPGGAYRMGGCQTIEELRALAAIDGQRPDGRGRARPVLETLEAGEGGVRGHSDSGGASRFFYVAKAPKKERPVVDGVAHPTVKPLALMRWLVKLVTPPGGTVLEPFAGSGATVEACILEGFDYIAIEREAEYLPLIQARIDRAA